MYTTEKIEIPAPKFAMYDTVKVNWEGAKYKGKIVRRLFDLNSVNQGCWLYNIGNLQTLFCEEAISSCISQQIFDLLTRGYGCQQILVAALSALLGNLEFK